MKDFTNYRDYQPFVEPLETEEYKILGYFPYETAGIYKPSIKIPRSISKEIEDLANLNDNKIVLICKDKLRFGTKDFAVFLHDGGCTFGSVDQVVGYANTDLAKIEMKDLGYCMECGRPATTNCQFH